MESSIGEKLVRRCDIVLAARKTIYCFISSFEFNSFDRYVVLILDFAVVVWMLWEMLEDGRIIVKNDDEF